MMFLETRLKLPGPLFLLLLSDLRRLCSYTCAPSVKFRDRV
jgi:hypothetical protein